MDDRFFKMLQETHDSTIRSETEITSLKHICGKMEEHLGGINGTLDDHDKRVDGMDNRVTILETKQNSNGTGLLKVLRIILGR